MQNTIPVGTGFQRMPDAWAHFSHSAISDCRLYMHLNGKNMAYDIRAK
jgi:hypothetical protein